MLMEMRSDLQWRSGQEFLPIWRSWVRKPVSWVIENGRTGFGCWDLQSAVPCLCFPVRMTGEPRHFTRVPCEHCGYSANATILAVLWCLFTRGLCEAAGAACAANSSKGANAWPVMSGVTRPRFQNTAVNKVKVSPFAGKEACFYELDSAWMK